MAAFLLKKKKNWTPIVFVSVVYFANNVCITYSNKPAVYLGQTPLIWNPINTLFLFSFLNDLFSPGCSTSVCVYVCVSEYWWPQGLHLCLQHQKQQRCACFNNPSLCRHTFRNVTWPKMFWIRLRAFHWRYVTLCNTVVVAEFNSIVIVSKYIMWTAEHHTLIYTPSLNSWSTSGPLRHAWFAEVGVKELKGPAKSLQHLWDKLERCLHLRPPRPTSVPDLDEWSLISTGKIYSKAFPEDWRLL